MKNLLKKLHIRPTQSSDSSSRRSASIESHPESQSDELSKPLSGITGWLNSVTNKRSLSPPSSSNLETIEGFDSVSSSQLEAAMDEVRVWDSGSGNSRDPEVEEEYQIQLALELSAREDPEAVQIEAVKQISLGSCPPENSPAEVLAFRYWNYSALSYDDKILDGFYDLYGILTGPTSSKIPSLVDLQKTPVSNNVTWEAIFVNKAADSKLLQLEQMALDISVKSTSESVKSFGQTLVQKLAVLVSDHMGGPVVDPDKMLIAWNDLSSSLKMTLGSMVFPLGSLKIGMACHRALLFKVLADSVGIPCRLVKGKQYTGSNNVAMNFIKLDDGREYIVDLMADPGTLIPSDTVTVDNNESFSSTPSSRSGPTSSSGESPMVVAANKSAPVAATTSNETKSPARTPHHVHARSPSWTEGIITSPAVRKLKVKDVSQYMMDAAKENPKLAQKLHDVLLESGVVAPPDLFYEDESPSPSPSSETQGHFGHLNNSPHPRFLPPLPKVPGKPENPAYMRNVPAAAAAAAAAASMVVAATRTIADPKMQLPVAAAATVTAAVVVATTSASVAKQYENENSNYLESPKRDGNSEIQENERISDRSTGNESTVSEVSLDDVADCEIAWEDITLGERIGLGSYGEV